MHVWIRAGHAVERNFSYALQVNKVFVFFLCGQINDKYMYIDACASGFERKFSDVHMVITYNLYRIGFWLYVWPYKRPSSMLGSPRTMVDGIFLCMRMAHGKG